MQPAVETAHVAEFVEELRKRGIGASVHFIPIPLHPAYAGHPGLAAANCPRAMKLYQRLVSLPLYPDLTAGELEYVADAVKAIAHQNHRAAVAVPAA